ncbi:hypothetical protein [Kitasatospora indigofera]|uniref:hypothetical protein n=1 Tax=Kitasatospora indigofera TaxID=67307 RepID=UPI0036CACF88
MIDFPDPDGAMWSNEEGDCWPQGVTLAQWLVAAMNGEVRFAWPHGVPPESEWQQPPLPPDHRGSWLVRDQHGEEAD